MKLLPHILAVLLVLTVSAQADAAGLRRAAAAKQAHDHAAAQQQQLAAAQKKAKEQAARPGPKGSAALSTPVPQVGYSEIEPTEGGEPISTIEPAPSDGDLKR